ncbi:ABC transporter permease [Cytophagales bacterium WSM2-2]|nr:ABC transporter permease [Cytophagales bacterium WSM2-2]
MLLNYLRIAYRTLFRNKSFSFINIFGLAVGTTAFLLILQYVKYEQSYESYNPNADNIFRITLDRYKGSEYVVTDCETHAPIAAIIKEKFPEVKDFVRMFHNDGLQTIKAGEKKFLEEGSYYADPSAFNMFSLHVLRGDASTALSNPMTAVITETLARKYFGRTDVTGETLDIDHELFHITAVIADIPSNTHLKFVILLSHSSLLKNGWYKEDDWNGNNEYTYLLMEPGTDVMTFSKKLSDLSLQLKDKLDGDRYTPEEMKSIHLYSHKTYEPEVNGSAKTVYFLLVIAVFIIVIAWVNYVNLATARAIERAREVGIRKVMGSVKSQLIFQFLAETVLVNVLAGILAFGFLLLLIPSFRNLTGQPLLLNFTDLSFWYLFGGLTLTGALLAGIYPAFVLSSFQPVAVLKGKFRSSSHGQLLRRGLVVLQFGTTLVLLISMVTVYLQIKHMRTADLGMNIDQVLIIRAPLLDGPESQYTTTFDTFKKEVANNPEVKILARSTSVPGLDLHELSSTQIVRHGQDRNRSYEYYYYGIDANFIPTMNMTLVAGRNFSDDMPNTDMVIINEEAVHRLGFANAAAAVGEKLSFHTSGSRNPSVIIGVTKNFYQRSPKEKHIPMLFQYLQGTNFFALRLTTAHLRETLDKVTTTYGKVFSGATLSYFFMDEKFNRQYVADTRFGEVIASFSGLAVFIACLGLFGLSSYTIVQRTKEIGIRKVLGASVIQIVQLLSQDFARVILLATVVALPAAWWAMTSWLSNYEVRVQLNPWMFVAPSAAILLIALITVSFQTMKTALSNPTDSLKQE